MSWESACASLQSTEQMEGIHLTRSRTFNIFNVQMEDFVLQTTPIQVKHEEIKKTNHLQKSR